MKPDPTDQRCPNCYRQRSVVFLGDGKCRCNRCGYEFERTYAKKPKAK